MRTAQFRPHDLLWVRVPDRFEPCAAWPDWLDAAWLLQAPLVVRRDAAPGTRVPVGARGGTRSQRCKGYVQRNAVVRCVSPEMLARDLPATPDVPALALLAELAPALDALGLSWGPTGGAGFQLATGLPVLRPDSDLDLLVRSAAPLASHRVDALARLQAQAGCRVDIQVDTGCGGFAFSEYLQGHGRVLLKTSAGPHLVADPWRWQVQLQDVA